MAFKLLHNESGNEVWVNTDLIAYAKVVNGNTALAFAFVALRDDVTASAATRTFKMIVRETPGEIFRGTGSSTGSMIG